MQDYDDDSQAGHLIVTYLSHLLTAEERSAIWALGLHFQLEGASEPMTRAIQTRIDEHRNPEVDRALAVGWALYTQEVSAKLRRDPAVDELLNRCPQCSRLPRTPRAKQCPWCHHDWHDSEHRQNRLGRQARSKTES